MNKYQKGLIDFMKTGKIEIKLKHLSQRQLIRLVEDLQQRIDKAIELLEKENYHCPMSLTVEKAYIIEVEKINNVISKLRGEE